MAHYAFITDGIVTEVITGVDENTIQTDTDGTQVGGNTEAWEAFYGNFRGQVCKRTSYNSNIRGIYAGIGYLYNEEEDIFVTPQPYPSWTRIGSFWNAPVAYPNDEGIYNWNESTLSWDLQV
jgi:hypothetical protein